MKALRESAAKNTYAFNGPYAQLLETFSTPEHMGLLSLEIEAPEFTSLCPITNQPDFATIIVNYDPRDKCVESKSFKLYLTSFRNAGMFHEDCVSRIAGDLIKLLDPDYLQVIGNFTPRGGIPFKPVITYTRAKQSGIEYPTPKFDD